MLNFLEGFAFNYNSLNIFEACLLWLVSFFTFSIVKEKSRALISFLLVLGVGTFSLIGYVFSQGFYEPIKWPRLLLLTLIPFQQFFTILFCIYFPDANITKKQKLFLIILLAIILPAITLLNYHAIKGEMRFDFYGHFYEFDIPHVLKVYTITLMFLTITVQGFALWKFFSLPKGEKKGYGWISLAIFLGYIIPAGSNALNTVGIIDRSFFIGLFSLSTSLALFIWIVSFINHTEDRTTFLFKIIGVTFTTFIILFAIATVVIMNEKEKTYDELKNREWKTAVFEGSQFSDLIFIHTLGDEKEELKIYSKENITGDSVVKEYLYKIYWYNKILNLPNQREILEEDIEGNLLSNSSKFYWKCLYAQSPSNQKEKIIETIPLINKKFFKLQNKIREISEENFRQEFFEFWNLEKNNCLSCLEIISEILKDKMKNPKKLKEEVLNLFEPLIFPQNRWYGFSQNKEQKLVLFHYLDKQQVYQFAYSYPAYRNYIHSGAMSIFYIVLFGTVLSVAGIPTFLFRSLIKPLGALLVNIREVRKGNLKVETQIKVYDEIGYLAQSFNNMVKAIRESKEQLQEYAEKLEEKVKERTKELAESLQKVEELKAQQDGDYFLTTLLLNPFGVVEKESGNIKLDFFIKQKKEFTFKNKTYQIGGDTCLSNKIQLKGKTYLVFLNADAMGKSIQGAGGILVLGSVFESIIQRTKNYKDYSETSPENWIKQAFKELHKIFETFDGSMLVSALFGLVDDTNGFVYFINAEHPWMILYRDKKAEFIEEKTNFRKLGYTGLNGEIFISSFQMEPGDLLIMGSDGKDDLVFYKDNNIKAMNEDESLFLKNVEECEGNLKKIYKLISERYEIIDDFSLLSIYFTAQEQEKYRIEVKEVLIKAKQLIKQSSNLNEVVNFLEGAYQNYQNKEVLKLLTWVYQKSDRLQAASNAYRAYLQRNDAETEFLFNASICFKKTKDIEEAIELSERVKLREPYNIRNLLHLADMYIYKKNLEEAKKILNKILTYEPENEKAQFLLGKVRE